MPISWDRAITRAEQLAAADASMRAPLVFFAGLLRAQRDLHQYLQRARWQPSGSVEHDLELLRPRLRPFVQSVAELAPAPLADEGRRLLTAAAADIDAMLLACWRVPSDRQFFPKAILQPYAGYLAERRIAPVDRMLGHSDNQCPFCGGAPQLSILRPVAEGETGGRLLQCANCLTDWPFRRVVCANCGEEDERKLGYFNSPAFDHLRLDACDTCKHYLKTVDLTRLGVAVPIIDEIAGAPLDVWAGEHGYKKIELNLVGL